MKRRPNCTCRICHTPLYRRPSQLQNGGVYCSSRCYGTAQQKTKECKICHRTYIGNKRTCSHSCANKARAGIVYTKEGRLNKAYQGTVLKEKVATERGGACERCHLDNYAILQIHHKVERHRGGGDALTNLELLCPNCHATHHLGKSLFVSIKNGTVLPRKK